MPEKRYSIDEVIKTIEECLTNLGYNVWEVTPESWSGTLYFEAQKNASVIGIALNTQKVENVSLRFYPPSLNLSVTAGKEETPDYMGYGVERAGEWELGEATLYTSELFPLPKDAEIKVELNLASLDLKKLQEEIEKNVKEWEKKIEESIRKELNYIGKSVDELLKNLF